MTNDRLEQILGGDFVQAIDGYFDNLDASNQAMIQGDYAAAARHLKQARDYLKTWLALLIERLDSRAAAMLVDLHEREEAVEQRVAELERHQGEQS